jgi:hypothetical protein
MPDSKGRPTGSSTVEEILAWLESEGGSPEAVRWMTENLENLPDETYTSVVNELKIKNAGTATGMYGTRTEPGKFDKVLDVAEQRGQDTAEVNKARSEAEQAAMAAGATPEQAAEVAQQAEDGVLMSRGELVPVPDIIMSAYGKAPSVKQQNELINSWNELNPDAPVRTYEELAKRMNDSPSAPIVEDVVAYAATGQEPMKVYEWEVGGFLGQGSQSSLSTTTVRVSEGQFAALKEIYGSGFTMKDVKKLAQLAARIGLNDATNMTPGRDSPSGGVGWQILAAGAAAMGMWNIGTRSDAADARAAANEIDPETARHIGAAGAAMQAAATPTGSGTAITNAEMTRLRNWGLQFKTGMAMYGMNDSLAFIHAMNPSLATRVATTEFDKLSTADKRQTYSMMMNAGFDAQNLGRLGYGWAAGFDELDVNKGAAAAASGPVRSMPDPEAVRQSAKDMYRQLFVREPTEAELNALVGNVTAALMSSDVDGSDGVVQNVDAGAQIRKNLESNPQYQELYGAKPAGMSEEEYQAQFRNGARSILGNAAPQPDIIRSGMRSGQYNTTVGAAAMTREAWEGSTFLGRLAQAAQITSENT